MLQLNQQPIKLIDDPDLSYLFEEKRRTEVEKLQVGINDNFFQIKSGKSSLAKSELSSFSKGGGMNPSLPFNPAFGGTFTPTYKVQKKIAAPGKGSLAKSTTFTENRKSKMLVSEPFFKEAGVQRPHKLIKQSLAKLTLEELQDIELFIPDLEGIELMRYIPEWRINRAMPIEASEVLALLESKKSTPSFKKPENKGQMNQKQTPSGKSGKQSAKTKITGISAETIQAGVETGLIDWDQVVFNKETLNALEQNIYMLDQTAK